MTNTRKTQTPARRAHTEVDGIDWSALMTMTPASDEDAGEAIAAAVLAAATPEAMNSATSSEKLAEFNNHVLRVRGVRHSKSSLQGDKEYFLIVTADDMTDGNEVVITTSASQPVAMLVKSHISEWLPADFKVNVSEKPTKAGYHPINLEYLGRPVTDEDGGEF